MKQTAQEPQRLVPRRWSLRYRNKEGYFLTVTPLDKQYIIARSARSRVRDENGVKVNIVDFVLIDDNTGHVLQDLFRWKYLNATNASQTPTFTAHCSSSRRFIVITGPTGNHCCNQKVKVISRREPATLCLNVSQSLLSDPEMVFTLNVLRQPRFHFPDTFHFTETAHRP